MAYSFYNAYQSKTNTGSTPMTPAAKFRWDLQQFVNSDFEIASDYYVIQKQDRSTGVWSDYGVRIEAPFAIKQQFTIKDDYRKFIFKDGTTVINMGDMFIFNDYYWMVVDVGRLETPTASCIVQRCNVQLKFTETALLYEDIITIYGVSSTFYANPLNIQQYVTLPDTQMQVRVPNDANSRKILASSKGGTRFLIGNPYRNWRTIGMDTVSEVRPTFAGTVVDDVNGMIMFKLQLEQLDPNDDLVNGVAYQDYF